MPNNETYTCSPSEVCLSNSDSELLILTPWSDESKNEKGQKDKGTDVMKDKVSQEHACKEEVPLNNNIGKQSGDFVEMPSTVSVHVNAATYPRQWITSVVHVAPSLGRQSVAMFSTEAEDIAAAGCYAIILWIESTH
ncbi:hypothetical protein Tco_0222242 [Tanacetum coccineum]